MFYKGLTEWLDKHNRYATAEAQATVETLCSGHGLDSAILSLMDSFLGLNAGE